MPGSVASGTLCIYNMGTTKYIGSNKR
jgi:hypothetical protein